MQEQIHLNIQNGNVRSKEEFDLFFQKYYSLFLSFTYRYRLSQEEAEDIVQEVFIHFWEQRFNFSDIISIKVFFYRSIRNRCLNYFKHEEIRERYADSVAKIPSGKYYSGRSLFFHSRRNKAIARKGTANFNLILVR